MVKESSPAAVKFLLKSEKEGKAMPYEWPQEAIEAYQQVQSLRRARPEALPSTRGARVPPRPSEGDTWAAWKAYLRQKGALKGYLARRAAWQARLSEREASPGRCP